MYSLPVSNSSILVLPPQMPASFVLSVNKFCDWDSNLELSFLLFKYVMNDCRIFPKYVNFLCNLSSNLEVSSFLFYKMIFFAGMQGCRDRHGQTWTTWSLGVKRLMHRLIRGSLTTRRGSVMKSNLFWRYVSALYSAKEEGGSDCLPDLWIFGALHGWVLGVN